MAPIGVVPGAVSLHLVDGVSLLRPEDQVFSAMLAGFANQQLARNLARSTADGRENTVRAFAKLWMPNRSSTLGDLDIFVYQPTEPVATSEVQVGLWHGRWE